DPSGPVPGAGAGAPPAAPGPTAAPPQVGNNFNSPDTRLYLSQFASQPSTEYVKVLDDFEKLRGLFHELQAKIYGIEGTSDHNRFHLELCSSGMSVAVTHVRHGHG
ncbi:integrin alpha-L-like, partial [Pezoporus wallicus]|uniref:integrin alpha-L-like n=1 Tax=Pezoporus wallicus TaxID=35540 RepID=UPI00254AF7EB